MKEEASLNEMSAATAIESKMRTAGIGGASTVAFLEAYQRVREGDRGMIRESDLLPAGSLPRLEELGGSRGKGETALAALAVFKLNGGLGTGMGLDRTKSLIAVRGQENFLEFIVRQVLHWRAKTGGASPKFLLMNSFTTRSETLEFLAGHPDLTLGGPVDFLQSRVPKLWADSLVPAEWPADPDLEWCPPGHGDFYPSLLNSGRLESLLAEGIRYGFVSNSDNLGATVDLSLLGYFAESGLSFLMEVAERTSADRKGGHLARRATTGRLLLRESAQCPKEDESTFQDISRHRFFNTNNLWIRLDHLADLLRTNDGSLRLPLITNVKTIDPKDANSPRVVQIESAMGAAIESFPDSGAVVVPRSRFSPVKSTNDLLILRSDACVVTDDHRLVLAPSRNGVPPIVHLDPKHYRVMSAFDAFFSGSIPSLLRCEALEVQGPVCFEAGVECQGKVTFRNASARLATARAGTYRDETVDLDERRLVP